MQLISLEHDVLSDCGQLGAWEMKHGTWTWICQVWCWCQVKSMESEPVLWAKWVVPRTQRSIRSGKRKDMARIWAKVNKSSRHKYTRFEGKRRGWSGVGLKSDHHGVSTTGRDQEKEQGELEQIQRTGQQQGPEDRRWWQGLQTCLEGTCSQVTCWAAESSWLDCVRCWRVVQRADQAGRLNFQFPGESAAACCNTRVKAVCQEQATVRLVLPVLQEFSDTALAAVFHTAEAYRASISIPTACFHETGGGLITFEVCPPSFQNVLISVTKFRSY